MSLDTSDIGEFESISRMLKQAEAEGLMVEVVWSFANEISAGQKNYAEAAWVALNEWDI